MDIAANNKVKKHAPAYLSSGLNQEVIPHGSISSVETLISLKVSMSFSTKIRKNSTARVTIITFLLSLSVLCKSNMVLINGKNS